MNENHTINRLLTKVLPKELEWYHPEKLKGNYWRECIVAISEYGDALRIVNGTINPINDYKDYEIRYSNLTIQGKHKTIGRNDIVAVGLFKRHWYLNVYELKSEHD